MSETEIIPPKPVTEQYRPEIVRLPELTAARRLARWVLRGLVRLLVWLLARVEVRGLENVPPSGGLLAVSNHLGDADVPIGLVATPRPLDIFAKAELFDYPVLGKLLEAYGVIWIHRGRPDRRAIRAGIQALEEGRMIAIAPEGRESLTGAMEEGTSGAAYMALKTGAALLPVALTGTENRALIANLRRLRRTRMTLTIGAPFHLEAGGDRQADIQRGTEQIMQTIAKLLPPAYRGVYNQEGLEADADRSAPAHPESAQNTHDGGDSYDGRRPE